MRQSLSNLLVNALRHTPGGGRIDVDLVSDNGAVRIRIQDTGCGIPPDLLPHVFERFRRAGPETGGGRSGPWLWPGLALGKNIVQLPGGTVEASSDGPGHGATFTVTLPLIRG